MPSAEIVSPASLCVVVAWTRSRSSVSPACFPPTVLSQDVSLSSTGSLRDRFPRFHGTTNTLRLPAAHPAALRCLRLAVPLAHAPFAPAVAACYDGGPGGGRPA